MDYEPRPELHPDEAPTAPGMFQETEPLHSVQYPYPPAQQTPSPYPPAYGSPKAPPATPWPWNPQGPQTPPERGGRRWIWLAVGAAVLVAAFIGLALALAAISTPTGQTSSPVATSTTLPTATKQTSRERAQVYINLITPHVLSMQADVNKVAADCKGSTVAACKAANQKVYADAVAFRTFLNEHHPPVCLDTADTELRAGLTEYINGSTLYVQGINTKEVSKVDAAKADYTKGNAYFQQAGNSMSLASTTC